MCLAVTMQCRERCERLLTLEALEERVEDTAFLAVNEEAVLTVTWLVARIAIEQPIVVVEVS